MRIYLLVVLFFTIQWSFNSKSLEFDPSLNFLISGNSIKEIPLSELKSTLTVHEISFFDPEYSKQKRYEAFALKDVLQLGFGTEWQNPDFTEVSFQSLDGYEALSSISKMKEDGAYIVFRDLNAGGWEPIGRKGANPGPFYLVWTGKDQSTKNKYPWPWQLMAISLIRFQDQYPGVYPKGASVDSRVYEGFVIFKGRCLRCHSMNRQGGKVGPDLNAPKSIVSYRSTKMIKEFISHPSKYRYTEMPDHMDLSEQDLDNIISYFKYMNEFRD